MLRIITGEICSGKTTRLIASYSEQQSCCADGFASIKTYKDGDVTGYTLRRLAGDLEIELAVKSPHYKGQFDAPLSFDQYIFNREAFRAGERIVRSALANNLIRIIYIDEIGPIELQKEGFHKLLADLISERAYENKDICICVRTNCLQEVIKEFKISSYLLLP